MSDRPWYRLHWGTWVSLFLTGTFYLALNLVDLRHWEPNIDGDEAFVALWGGFPFRFAIELADDVAPVIRPDFALFNLAFAIMAAVSVAFSFEMLLGRWQLWFSTRALMLMMTGAAVLLAVVRIPVVTILVCVYFLLVNALCALHLSGWLIWQGIKWVHPADEVFRRTDL